MAITISPMLASRPENVAEIRALMDEETLPVLTGSEKQVAWATDLRASLLPAAAKSLMSDLHDDARGEECYPGYTATAQAAFQSMRGQTEARWWIDHRNDSGDTLMNALIRASQGR